MAGKHRALATDALPTRLGAFDIVEVIGHGASSVVMSATPNAQADTFIPQDTQVAIKYLTDFSAAQLQSFRREIEVLRQLDHPGIVNILAHGVSDSRPWYAMPHYSGPTLDQGWVPRRSDIPLRDVLIKFRYIAETLAFVHAQGLVHRDIKPANVLVKDDSLPLLVDFGFAGRFSGSSSREQLASGGDLIGTIAYIAPEQALGHYVDARADLYSLGCMLYQAIAGETPFVGASEEVINLHINQPAPRLRFADASVDPRLEALVARLLEKDPHNRIGYAVDVVRELDELLTYASETPLPSVNYVYQPRFYGRRAQLSALQSAISSAEASSGLGVLIMGASGAGKTRLAMEATRETADSALKLVVAESTSREHSRSSAPLSALQGLISEMVEYCGDSSPRLAEVFGERAGIFAAYEPRLMDVPTFAEPQPLGPADARDRLVRCFAECVSAYARHVPVCLVVDDLQWVDETSVACLVYLMERHINTLPILVIATCREEEQSFHIDAFRDAASRELDVEALGEGAVGEVIADMLALTEAPHALVKLISRESEGNPFYVGEYVRSALGSGLLIRNERGQWQLTAPIRATAAQQAGVSVPLSIKELATNRLGELAEEPRNFVQAAAVAGREFSPETVANMALVDLVSFANELNFLIARHFFEPHEDGNLRFIHDKLREGAYETLESSSRQRLHKRFAQILSINNPDAHADLAYHWLNAGEYEAALEHFGAAAVSAAEAGAHNDTLQIVDMALALPEAHTLVSRLDQSHWLRLRSSACYALGDLDGTIESALESLRRSGIAVPSTSLGWTLQILKEAAKYTLRRPTKESTSNERNIYDEASLAAVQAATSAYHEFRVTTAVANSFLAINLAKRSNNSTAAIRAHGQLAYLMGAVGLRGVAEGFLRRGMEMKPNADPHEAGAFMYWSGMYRIGQCEWDKAEADCHESVALLTECGDQQESEIGRTILAAALGFCGKVKAGLREATILTSAAEQRLNDQHVAWGLTFAARCHLAQGDADIALEYLEQASESLRLGSDVTAQMMANGTHAAILYDKGRKEEALAILDTLMLDFGNDRAIPLAQCLDGYRWLALVNLEEWRTGNQSRRAHATRACKLLRQFAGYFPMATSAHLHAQAKLALCKSKANATQLYEQALLTAQNQGMPGEADIVVSDMLNLPELSADPEAYQRYSTTKIRLREQLNSSDSKAHV